MALHTSINTFLIGVSAFALLFLADVAQHLAEKPEPPPESEPTKYPIVLLHGLLGGPVSTKKIERALRKAGYQAYSPSAPPLHNIKTRSAFFAKQIDSVLNFTNSEKVNIIAHSMGGIDARYLISHMGYGDKVASLTTISTSHHGLPLASLILRLTANVDRERLSEAGRIIGRELTIDAMANIVDVRAGFHDLSFEQMEIFNAQTPDDERVYYQSWAGLSKVGGWPHAEDLAVCGRIWRDFHFRDTMNFTVSVSAWLTLKGNQHPSDGIVPVISAKWGRFRGCVHGDHLDVLGIRAPDRYSGFDYKRFYLELVFELSQMGY